MCGRAAAAGGLQALGGPAHRRRPGHGVHDDPRAVLALLQAGHHGLGGDGAELVGEGAVEDQDVHGEDPLADGGDVLQDEALVDEEYAAWREDGLRRTDAFLQRLGRKMRLLSPLQRGGQTHGLQMCVLNVEYIFGKVLSNVFVLRIISAHCLLLLLYLFTFLLCTNKNFPPLRDQ